VVFILFWLQKGDYLGPVAQSKLRDLYQPCTFLAGAWLVHIDQVIYLGPVVWRRKVVFA